MVSPLAFFVVLGVLQICQPPTGIKIPQILVGRITRPSSLAIVGIVGARIAAQTAAGVRIAGISHRSILKNMPTFCIAGQHRRIFAESFSGSFL